MALYEDIKNAIQRKYYSLLDAQDILNAFMKKLQLTTERYEELMELHCTMLRLSSLTFILRL